MLKVHFKKQKKNNKLSAAHKCKGNKIALTNFTIPFNCSSRLKDKLISVHIIYVCDFEALILLFVHKCLHLYSCISII